MKENKSGRSLDLLLHQKFENNNDPGGDIRWIRDMEAQAFRMHSRLQESLNVVWNRTFAQFSMEVELPNFGPNVLIYKDYPFRQHWKDYVKDRIPGFGASKNSLRVDLNSLVIRTIPSIYATVKYRERWGVVAKMIDSSVPLIVEIGIKRMNRLGMYTLWNVYPFEDIAALLPLEYGERFRCEDFLSRLDALEKYVRNRFATRKYRDLGEMFIRNESSREGILTIGEIDVLPGGNCGFCAQNGQACIPIIYTPECNLLFHEDCLVEMAEKLADGNGIARCTEYGCEKRIVVSKEIMEKYLGLVSQKGLKK